MIGLKRGMVKVVPYNKVWKKLYNREEILLYSVIGKYIVDIQHVGSTSIGGLDSKPIIDIALGVKSLDDTHKFRNRLEGIGYHYRGDAGVKGRILFAKGTEDLRTHYLHIEPYKGDLWFNHICFRDYLLLHRELIEEYSKLKMKFADNFFKERKAYTRAKNEFINSVLEKAKSEFLQIK